MRTLQKTQSVNQSSLQKRRSVNQRELDHEYYMGVLSALAPLKTWCGVESPEYDEVAKHFDLAALLRAAKKSGNEQMSGIDEYARWVAMPAIRVGRRQSKLPASVAKEDRHG